MIDEIGEWSEVQGKRGQGRCGRQGKRIGECICKWDGEQLGMVWTRLMTSKEITGELWKWSPMII